MLMRWVGQPAGYRALNLPPFEVTLKSHKEPLACDSDLQPHAMINLEAQQVLSLNKHWIVCGIRSVRKAIVCLCSETDGEPPALVLDMEMARDENGDDVMVYANPVDWDEWVKLPVRANDLYVTTAHAKIRAPLVIICRNYDKVPMTKPRFSVGNVFERDQGICQYTGRKLSRAEASVDHVVPRFRGGVDSWTNCVTTSKKLNAAKGCQLNSEVGLNLIREPKAPKSIPFAASIKESRYPWWKPFLVQT